MAKDRLPPAMAGRDLRAFMREALAEAETAGLAGELPIGAVLVVDGGIVARGRARQRELHSQLAHAELQALLTGGEALWKRYERTVLFTTMEPCPMCLGATVMTDVPHIVFAARSGSCLPRLSSSPRSKHPPFLETSGNVIYPLRSNMCN